MPPVKWHGVAVPPWHGQAVPHGTPVPLPSSSGLRFLFKVRSASVFGESRSGVRTGVSSSDSLAISRLV